MPSMLFQIKTPSQPGYHMLTGMGRKLHIGGQVRVAGWEVFDANPGPVVDHVGNASDLSRFDDNTFDEIYASHVVEHFDYTGELLRALTEWHRVLVHGGILYVSVPDLDVLARLFLDRQLLSAKERFQVMRIIFGGHLDKYDYHLTGLNDEFLGQFLAQAGFSQLFRAGSFNLFDDTSDFEVRGVRISLNMVAKKAG